MLSAFTDASSRDHHPLRDETPGDLPDVPGWGIMSELEMRTGVPSLGVAPWAPSNSGAPAAPGRAQHTMGPPHLLPGAGGNPGIRKKTTGNGIHSAGPAAACDAHSLTHSFLQHQLSASTGHMSTPSGISRLNSQIPLKASPQSVFSFSLNMQTSLCLHPCPDVVCRGGSASCPSWSTPTSICPSPRGISMDASLLVPLAVRMPV